MQDINKRSNLKINVIMCIVLALLGGSLFGLLYGVNSLTKDSVHVYNCSISEISPDFTPAMRDECRRLRAK